MGKWEVPPGPEEVARKILAGHCLTNDELERLRADAQASQKLEFEDPNYARACRKWRAQFAEDGSVRPDKCPAPQVRAPSWRCAGNSINKQAGLWCPWVAYRLRCAWCGRVRPQKLRPFRCLWRRRAQGIAHGS